MNLASLLTWQITTENSMSGQPLAYRVKDFCARVGICPATFYKLVKLKKIRVVKFGGRTLVPASEVDRLLGEDI
ncbi:helix-turn-helix domain-containing protein [Methylocystis sp.]|uniref:helix-turn-helix domain-containing protein n=1 Tax=Methylocystis sp. TaxID=1911079 RepID=UPI0035261003